MSETAFDIDPDIRVARTLPARIYSDPALFRAQRERVFARTWQYAATTMSSRSRTGLSRSRCSPARSTSRFCSREIRRIRSTAFRTCARIAGRSSSRDRVTSSSCAAGTTAAASRSTAAFTRCPSSAGTAALSLARRRSAARCPGNVATVPHGRARAGDAVRRRRGTAPRTTRPPPFPSSLFDAAGTRDYFVNANWALYVDNYLEVFTPAVHNNLGRRDRLRRARQRSSSGATRSAGGDHEAGRDGVPARRGRTPTPGKRVGWRTTTGSSRRRCSTCTRGAFQ